MPVLKPPTPLHIVPPTRHSVFLAGSIDMGRAESWQPRVESALADIPVTIWNPRRDPWDVHGCQSIDNPDFVEQVNWELDAQEKADLILMYFSPSSQAPITLLELGLFARSGRLILACPSGFWRKGNVDVVASRYRIAMTESLEDLVATARLRLSGLVRDL